MVSVGRLPSQLTSAGFQLMRMCPATAVSVLRVQLMLRERRLRHLLHLLVRNLPRLQVRLLLRVRVRHLLLLRLRVRHLPRLRMRLLLRLRVWYLLHLRPLFPLPLLRPRLASRPCLSPLVWLPKSPESPRGSLDLQIPT